MMVEVTDDADDADEVESGKGNCLGIGVDIDSLFVISIHPRLDSTPLVSTIDCRCTWYSPVVA